MKSRFHPARTSHFSGTLWADRMQRKTSAMAYAVLRPLPGHKIAPYFFTYPIATPALVGGRKWLPDHPKPRPVSLIGYRNEGYIDARKSSRHMVIRELLLKRSSRFCDYLRGLTAAMAGGIPALILAL